MPSVATVIKTHNSKILRNSPAQDEETRTAGCNCRNKELCPLEGACLTKSIVYKASVETDAGVKEYTGLTATTFKQRYYNHQLSFRDTNYQNSTALSKHIWSLKGNNVDFAIQWWESREELRTSVHLRSSFRLSHRLPCPRPETLRCSPFYCAFSLWNSLPSSSKLSLSTIRCHFSGSPPPSS